MCLTEKEAKEYREYLEKLASVKSAEMFSNGGRDHAVVLYSVLLENACLHARFFCESGMSAIWTHPTFKSALVNALRKADFKVDVLTRNQAEPDFEWLPAELKNKVRVKTISKEKLGIINSHFKTDSCNFSVFDNEMFRFEYDVVNFKAYGSFNEPAIGQSMVALFDDCFDAA